jgi:hypothetical protein
MQKHRTKGLNVIIKLNVVKKIDTKISYNKTRQFNKPILQVNKMIK